MRKLVVIVASMAILALPALALAGVTGSDHDLTGAGEKLCFACHIPHNALGDKLWAQTPSGTFTGVQDLCFTCHDGTPTSIGLTTAFDLSDEQHAVVGPDCSDGGGSACHDVHNQNPNTTGRFLVVTETNNSYCVTCHDGTQFPGAEGLGDHTAGLTHFTDATFTCDQCHSAHGATPQSNNPVGLTNPILLADNIPSYYGAFCISCHNGTAPAEATQGSGGQAATDVFDYAEVTNDGTEWKHPTISTTGATPVGGCDKCHDVHDPLEIPPPNYLLKADNLESAYCLSCHTQAGAPQVGANSHYLGAPSDASMNNGLSPALPWANEIDEDGNAGIDWPGAGALIVCESCHSVHRQGYQVTPAYLLRDDNSNNEICTACHTDQG
jgi:hypothetical protein